MKKFMALLVTAVMSVGLLAGCGEKTFKLSEIKTSKYVSTIGQYKGLTVEAKAKTVLDEESYEYFNQYMFAEFVQNSIPKDYQAELGDTLILDYVGTKDDVAFEGGSAEATYLTLGSGMFIPGFEESLVGVKVGDVKDIDLTFPENYHNADLAGAAVVFKCTIHSVIPAYSDESIALINNSNFSNVDEYKAYVKDYVDNMINDSYREEVVGGALAQIEASTVVKSIPEELLAEQKKAVMKSYEAASAQMAMSVDDLLKQYGSSVEEQTEKYAKRTLICQAIANEENITVTDEEVKEAAEKFVAEAEGFDTLEQFYEEYGYEYYKNYLMSQKVYDLILETANVVDPGSNTETTVSEDAKAEESQAGAETDGE